MNRIRWASSSMLVVALGSFGCRSNSTTTKDASVECQDSAGCYYDDESYAIGDDFFTTDGCLHCFCRESGLACGKLGVSIKCGEGCEGPGGWQESGTTVPAGDGCNTCSCINHELGCSDNVCLDAGTGDPGGITGTGGDAETGDAVSAGEASVPTSDAH